MVDGAVGAQRSGTAADRIVFLGHATVLIELEGVRVLTDPLLRGGVVHLRRQVPAVEASVAADPDAVLISHLHHDHLDLGSLRRLGVDTPLIVPAGAGAWLERRGFTRAGELSAGESAKVGALTVTAVEAHHDARRPGAPRAEPLGYLVSGRQTVYFAGDTELFAGMADLSPSPDVALVPIAGWGAKLGPGHMDPLDAARAVELIQPRIAIPVHWGTLRPIGLGRHHRERLSEPPRLFVEHVALRAPNVEVRTLTPGQQTML
ncbi:MAG TPA: MBL fold metallo-hydrolase [Solirubrobacteraceae bacterium]|nr:MBL fold metallo-hydrolase [Solirubrobacteraceae bacterium]